MTRRAHASFEALDAVTGGLATTHESLALSQRRGFGDAFQLATAAAVPIVGTLVALRSQPPT